MDKRVETIKQEVEETLGDMNAKIEEIETRVHDSVDHVKQTAQETVDTVREKVDVRLVVERRPWTAFGASLAVGFLLGRMGRSDEEEVQSYVNSSTSSAPLALTAPTRSASEQRFVQALPGETNYEHPSYERSNYGGSNYKADSSNNEPSRAKELTQRTISQVKRKAPGVLDSIRSQFSGEIEALKKAAIFSATNVLRETLQSKAPDFAQAFDRARQQGDDVSMKPRSGSSPETVYESNDQPTNYASHGSSYSNGSSSSNGSNGHSHQSTSR